MKRMLKIILLVVEGGVVINLLLGIIKRWAHEGEFEDEDFDDDYEDEDFDDDIDDLDQEEDSTTETVDEAEENETSKAEEQADV